MQRFVYQLVGFVVVRGARAFLRQRYGDRPKKVAVGAVLVAVVAAVLLALRRGSGEPD